MSHLPSASDPEATYCASCQETLLDGPANCPECDEPTILWSDHCEAAYMRQQEDMAAGDGPLSLDEQHRAAWQQKQELRR